MLNKQVLTFANNTVAMETGYAVACEAAHSVYTLSCIVAVVRTFTALVGVCDVRYLLFIKTFNQLFFDAKHILKTFQDI